MKTLRNTNIYKKRAREEGVTSNAIYKRMRKEKNDSHCGEKKRGRPRSTDSEDDRWIKARAKRLKMKSSKDHAKALKKYRARTVTPRTIRNRLLSFGLKSKWESKKPLLTQAHKEKRLRFAQDNAERDWKAVLFSDEASCWLGRRRKRVRVGPGEHPTCPTLKYPQKLHMWACISYHGVGKIYTFRENLTGDLYRTILRKAMLPSARTLFPKRMASTWGFQQDRDPKHTSKICQKFLNDKTVRVLWNPPQSPDLNPIENLWTPFKDKIAEKNPKNLDQLEKAIHTVWPTLEIPLLRSLIQSMPRRLEAVITNRGGHTTY